MPTKAPLKFKGKYAYWIAERRDLGQFAAEGLDRLRSGHLRIVNSSIP